ncbi:hypothetical protein SBA3_500046 [Candidatus Sulfopaludibacter sp. SbA3]|nr:hypothetical protein SBA3_500046 [Candidatus Sulfopaludibacter sp. SbA3]
MVVGVRPVYAPALVAFVGGGGFGVGVRVGGGVGMAAWFPLGPGEVYRPAYHVSDVYVRNVNIVHVSNVTVINNVNVTNVTYVNQRVNGGVTVVSNDAFVHARPVATNVVVVSHDEILRARVVGPTAQIAPVRESVVVTGGVAVHAPPARFAERPARFVCGQGADVACQRRPPPGACPGGQYPSERTPAARSHGPHRESARPDLWQSPRAAGWTTWGPARPAGSVPDTQPRQQRPAESDAAAQRSPRRCPSPATAGAATAVAAYAGSSASRDSQCRAAAQHRAPAQCSAPAHCRGAAQHRAPAQYSAPAHCRGAAQHRAGAQRRNEEREDSPQEGASQKGRPHREEVT